MLTPAFLNKSLISNYTEKLHIEVVNNKTQNVLKQFVIKQVKPISNSLCIKKGHFENRHEIKDANWPKQYFVEDNTRL